MNPTLRSIRLAASKVKFRSRIALKSLIAKVPRPIKLAPTTGPAVTIFISNLNTRFALEMTLRSLLKATTYSPMKIIVADNGSTDGSREFLVAVAQSEAVTVVQAEKPRPHSSWLDEALCQCETKYLFAVDSDMLFLGGDPIAEMVSVMEQEPDVYLLSADIVEPRYGEPDPFKGTIVDVAEQPFTWLMCIRRSLRDNINASFAVVVEQGGGGDGRTLVNDTGAVVLREMRRAGLRYRGMPSWFASRFEHIGSMTWNGATGPGLSIYDEMRRYKASEVTRRAIKLGRG